MCINAVPDLSLRIELYVPWNLRQGVHPFISGDLRESPRSALIGRTPHINYPSLRAWPPARRPSSPKRVTCSSSRLGSAICDTTPPCSAWQQTQVTPLSPYLPFHSLIPDFLSLFFCFEMFFNSPT